MTANLRIACVIACHNRRETTLRCLASLRVAGFTWGGGRRVYLCDDGSTDGTAAAVRERFPHVVIVPGSGSLYWGGGTRAAMRVAADWDPNWWWLINDDTVLEPGALGRMLEAGSSSTKPCIVVGSCADSASGRIVYGGRVSKSRLFPLRVRSLIANAAMTQCDFANGNCLLIHRDVVAATGGVDPVFRHGFGDWDLTFRARKMGFPLLVSPGIAATCGANPMPDAWPDRRLPRRERLRRIMSVKGFPPYEWLVFCARHCGPFFWATWAWTYLRILVGRR